MISAVKSKERCQVYDVSASVKTTSLSYATLLGGLGVFKVSVLIGGFGPLVPNFLLQRALSRLRSRGFNSQALCGLLARSAR